jgi:hypothetical protein
VASVLHPRAQLPHRPCDRDGGPIDSGEMLADSVSDEGLAGRKLRGYRVLRLGGYSDDDSLLGLYLFSDHMISLEGVWNERKRSSEFKNLCKVWVMTEPQTEYTNCIEESGTKVHV